MPAYYAANDHMLATQYYLEFPLITRAQAREARNFLVSLERSRRSLPDLQTGLFRNQGVPPRNQHPPARIPQCTLTRRGMLPGCWPSAAGGGWMAARSVVEHVRHLRIFAEGCRDLGVAAWLDERDPPS